MSTGLEIVLRWRFVPQVGDRDMRTFDIFFEYQAGVQPIHLFKVSYEISTFVLPH